MWSVISAELTDPSLLDEKIAAYADQFAFAKVSNIDEFIRQTYGGTINAIGMAAYTAVGVALMIALLITLLFMRMLVAKDRYAIAVMKALRFYKLGHTGAVCGAFGFCPGPGHFARHTAGKHARRGADGGGDRFLWGGLF
jgi:hypothetical protein